jgi:hypothetical protein
MTIPMNQNICVLIYREAYPKAHPFFKTLVLLSPKGNMSKGNKKLNLGH